VKQKVVLYMYIKPFVVFISIAILSWPWGRTRVVCPPLWCHSCV